MPEQFSNFTDKLTSWTMSFQDKKKRRVELSAEDESQLETAFKYFFQDLIKNLQIVSELLDIPNKESNEFIFGSYKFVGNYRSLRHRYVFGEYDMGESPIQLVPYDRLYPEYVLGLLDNSAVVPKRTKILTRYLKDLEKLRDELERSDLLGPEVTKNLTNKR